MIKKQQISNTADSTDRVAVSYFDQFRTEVESELKAWSSSHHLSTEKRDQLLNGGANTAAFDLIPQDTRKKYGIFFSGHELAQQVASKISHLLAEGATVIDPACGAADLLIACARCYPRQATYSQTIEYWATKLAGIDLHESFLATAKFRLMLLATEYSSNPIGEYSSEELFNRFVDFHADDALQHIDRIKGYNCVVTNPPYGSVDAPEDITWASGKLQVAGLFIDKILKAAAVGQEIVAVLPDVLRSGTRYELWRTMVAEHADILSIDIVGKFDKTTDVDVFIVHLKRSDKPAVGWEGLKVNFVKSSIVSEYFNVHVGAVVPHRHEDTGKSVPYIDCSCTSGKKEVTPTKIRGFGGTKFQPPFVAIHRTSSPDDATRLVTSIVINETPVAVENHIIVALPLDGSIQACKELVRQLKGEEVKTWLNERIRCRHLTVSAIKEIPYKQLLKNE